MNKIRKYFHLSFSILLFSCILTMHPMAFSATGDVKIKEKETELKKLNSRIQELKNKLSSVTNKRRLFMKELAYTEKKINNSLQKIREQQDIISVNEKEIVSLESEISKLEQEMKQQQSLLAAHSRASYLMGEYQPIKWLFYPEQHQKLSRMNQYYLYIVKSRAENIEALKQSTARLKEKNKTLHFAIEKKQKTHQILQAEQQKLLNDKRYRQNLISRLNQTINKKTSELKTYEYDKKKLERMIYQLTYLSQTKHLKPFVKMKNKLPYPVKTDKNHIKMIHQGLVFFSKEGSQVKAIYPGTVVFSDWLKGYGLLLIIDHGRGYMSLYAHNESVYKKKGDEIVQGEVIASVGHSGGLKEDGLYFEIRYRGKTQPPLKWLA
jgi:septal ring factor EnvC (AmiA/AmiB activator)